MSRRMCLRCGIPDREHPIHTTGIDWNGDRIEPHVYDPGDRRSGDRRRAEDRPDIERRSGTERRQLVRRMDDRIARIRRATGY